MTPDCRPILAAMVAVAIAGSVQAHAKLVAAVPAAGSTGGDTRSLRLSFSETISAKLSGATVTRGGAVIPVAAGLADGGKVLTLMPKLPLTAGSYRVEWHAVASDDGHKTSGAYSFTIK